MLAAAKEMFAKGLWKHGGWSYDDRKCIVGTMRSLSGIDDASVAHRRPDVHGEFYTAYEEIIFTAAGLCGMGAEGIELEPNPERFYERVEEKKLDFFSYNHREPEANEKHELILSALSEAEDCLISFNDSSARTTREMLDLLEQAEQVIIQRREAEDKRKEENAAEMLREQIAKAASLGAETVVATHEESDTAWDEYLARFKALNPTATPYSIEGVEPGINGLAKQNRELFSKVWK